MKKLYVPTDSWYTNSTMINECLCNGYHLIGTIKSNRIISPKGINIPLSEFTQYINPKELNVVTVKDKDYRVFVYEGSIFKFKDVKVLFTYFFSGGYQKREYAL